MIGWLGVFHPALRVSCGYAATPTPRQVFFLGSYSSIVLHDGYGSYGGICCASRHLSYYAKTLPAFQHLQKCDLLALALGALTLHRGAK